MASEALCALVLAAGCFFGATSAPWSQWRLARRRIGYTRELRRPCPASAVGYESQLIGLAAPVFSTIADDESRPAAVGIIRNNDHGSTMSMITTNALCAGGLLLLASCNLTRITSTVGRAEYSDDFDPVENTTVVGLEISQTPPDGGIGFEAGFRYGKGSGVEETTFVPIEAETYEFFGGPRYEWVKDNWRPYLAGGLSVIQIIGDRADADSESLSDIGFYASAGIDYELGEGLYLGMGVRRTFEQAGVLYYAGDVDSWQYLLRFGVGF